MVSQSPFTPGVVIIHHGNGTALEHNYMPQMSFCVPHWKELVAAGRKKVLGRELGGEQASKKALWVQEERSSSRKGLEFGSQHSCNKSGILGNVCHLNSQSRVEERRRIAGACQLPA